MVHTCAACKCKHEERENSGETATPSAGNLPASSNVPNGWFVRCIDETNYVLCDVCGAQIHFRGGISPYLLDCLELSNEAQCDLSAEAAALGVERRRMRKQQ